MCRSINQVFILLDGWECIKQIQIKRRYYNSSKNTPKICKLEHVIYRNISKYFFSHFPRCGIHRTWKTPHLNFWSTNGFVFFLPTSSSFFLDSLFANLKIIYFFRSKQPIHTSFRNSLEFLIKLIWYKVIKINIRQYSQTFFQITFSSKNFLEASLENLIRPLYFLKHALNSEMHLSMWLQLFVG